MNIYESERLTMLVKRWVNLERISKKDYTENNEKYKKAYKKLIVLLVKQQSSSFQFNNASIDAVLKNLFK